MKRLCAVFLALVSFFMLGAAKVDVDGVLDSILGEMRDAFGHPCSIRKSEGMFSKFKGAELVIADCTEDEYGPVIYEFTEKMKAAFPDGDPTVSVSFYSDRDGTELLLGFTRSSGSDNFGAVLDYSGTRKAYNCKTFEDFVEMFPSVDVYIRRKSLTDSEREIYDAVSEFSAEHPDASDEELDRFICGKFGITVDEFNDVYFSAVAKMVY